MSPARLAGTGIAPRARAALACVGLAALAACGGSESEPAPGTLVLVTLDSTRADRIGAYGSELGLTPHLDRLAGDGTVYEDFVAAASGTNPSLATVFTGLDPAGHQLRSARHAGRHRLRPSVDTLAERLRERGWHTIGCGALPQLDERLSGLEQGFDVWITPAFDEDREPWSSAELLGRAREPIGAALASSEPVFLWVHFADARIERPAPGPDGAAVVARRLAPFRADPDVAAALVRLEAEPAAALEDLDRALARRRARPEKRAWQESLYDLAVGQADAGLGEVLAMLADAGRLDAATVAVVATQGARLERTVAAADGLSTYAVRDRQEAAEALWRVPAVVRTPIGSSQRIVALAAAADLAPELIALALGEPRVRAARELAVFGAANGELTDVAVEPDALWVGVPGSALIRQTRAAPPVQESVPADRVPPAVAGALLTETGLEIALPEGFAGTLRARLIGPWDLGVSAPDGGVRAARGVSLRVQSSADQGPWDEPTESFERCELAAGERARRTWWIGGERPALALHLERDPAGAPQTPDTALEGLALAGAAGYLPRLVPGAREPWMGPQEPVLDVVRAVGRRLRIDLTGPDGVEVELAITCWPPRAALDVQSSDAGVEVLPGRSALVLVRGKAPLSAEVDKGAVTLAFAATVAGAPVPARAMRYLGDAIADGRRASVVVPENLPPGMRGAPDAPDAPDTAGAGLWLAVHDRPIPADAWTAVSPDVRRFLDRLEDSE